MLFSSVEFLVLFLPITMLGFFLVGRVSRVGAAWWLAGASIVFYGWWSWRFVPLLVCSVVFNFVCGVAIAKLNASGRHAVAKGALVFAIAGDLTLLGYFKYADFLLQSWNAVSNSSVPLLHIILPLGISFFTFTQIAFLVDTYRGIARKPRFAHFLLFVTYFPHLIAGPVLHHKEMMPQFGHPSTYRFSWLSFGLGLSIFCLGLFKKTVLADGIAPHVAPAFAAAARGESLHLLMAWGGALAYSMRLYFDFSGYSDMAIGLSRMFGITLPLNFNSPYKASNISEFWRRWHMTLSRFLRDYLYIPLGGNRHGTPRRFANLIVVMFLGGLWHGASWTFALWGLLHGLYLVVHEAFKAVCERFRIAGTGAWPTRVAGILVTYRGGGGRVGAVSRGLLPLGLRDARRHGGCERYCAAGCLFRPPACARDDGRFHRRTSRARWRRRVRRPLDQVGVAPLDRVLRAEHTGIHAQVRPGARFP